MAFSRKPILVKQRVPWTYLEISTLVLMLATVAYLLYYAVVP